VSIGATLAAARRRAGLTVSDVSQRTRVTEPIIRGIEQDDYAACGGDFYARGHIRAIARAVGEDPVPLIDELIVHPVGSAGCDVDDVAERVAAIWSSKATSEGRSR